MVFLCDTFTNHNLYIVLFIYIILQIELVIMMLINDIVKTVQDYEENEWDSEARFKFYNVAYDTKTKIVKVFFVEEYHFDGDNWGEIETKSNARKILELEDVSAETYINMLVSVVNADQQELEYYYGNTLDKVSFVRV